MRLAINTAAVLFATLGGLDAVDRAWWVAAGYLIAAIVARQIAVRY